MYGTMHGFGRTAGVAVGVVCGLFTLSGCGGGSELERYDLAGRSLAVADYPIPSPDVRTGSYGGGGDDILSAVVEVGSGVAREVEARRARSRLDSAAVLVDVRRRLSEHTLERTARYTGTVPVDEIAAADYLLELYVRHFGIDARSGGPARLYMNVEAVLLDRRTGHEVWSIDVDSHDELTPRVRTGSAAAADIVTAGGLGTLDVDQLRDELAGLTDFTADYIMNELREDLRDARRR